MNGHLDNQDPQWQCDQIGRSIGLFKTFGNNLICQILGKFCKGAKIYHFSSEIIFRQVL